jgi:hypothetical protein
MEISLGVILFFPLPSEPRAINSSFGPSFGYSVQIFQLSKRSPEERSYTTLTTFETKRKKAPSGRDLQLSKVWSVYLVLRR